MALTTKGIWFSQTTADCSPHWVCETDEPCHNLSTIKNSSNTGNHCQFKLLKWLAQTEPCHSQHGIPKLSFAGGARAEDWAESDLTLALDSCRDTHLPVQGVVQGVPSCMKHGLNFTKIWQKDPLGPVK